MGRFTQTLLHVRVCVIDRWRACLLGVVFKTPTKTSSHTLPCPAAPGLAGGGLVAVVVAAERCSERFGCVVCRV